MPSCLRTEWKTTVRVGMFTPDEGHTIWRFVLFAAALEAELRFVRGAIGEGPTGATAATSVQRERSKPRL